ncbi:hypothetical protein [Sphingomonas sp.]|uniref:hypothetical protein n=1 Tax=Sphingomonas sp. TaxID=28214 RepID=UPI0025DE1701|nr:hypothetical protein [Sphingomonas sp.]
MTRLPGYLQVRRWVDRDLSDNRLRSVAMSATFLPIFTIVLIAPLLPGSLKVAGWIVALGTGSSWGVFIIWRAFKLAKAALIRGDRAYDQTGKLALPPEYRDTESAARALKRRGPRGKS